MGTLVKPSPVKRVKPGPAESPLEVIERTRALFGMRGTWTKGAETGPSKMWDNQRCLIRGLRDCDGKHVADATKLVLKAIGELYPTRGHSIPSFNDSTATTKRDVILVLDRAIEMATTTK
jgi:hypothetical protein